MRVPQVRSEGALTLAQSWWSGSDRPRQHDWRRRERQRDSWWGSDDEEDTGYYNEDRSTYRTLCVRLCDGFYWPISFATTPEHFERDERKCRSSCGSPARLYTYRNPGGEPEDMEDLAGRPYIRLKTAFLYRAQYNESCKCKSDPWEEASLDRHRMYALEAASRKGDKSAGRELAEMRKKVQTGARAAQSRQLHAAPAALVEAEPLSGSAPSTVAPARSERMSLGARSSSRPRSSGSADRLWRRTSEHAP